MKFPHILIGMAAVTLLLGMPERTLAQDYDDDIYYNPSKPAVPQKKSKTIKYTPTPDYPAADTYSQAYQSATAGVTSNMRDIDEYNRRGIFAPVDTADARVVNADTLGDFLYTRRIEAFHNPDVVTSTGNQDLIDYYYSQGYQQGLDDGTVTNITVNSVDPFWWPGYNWYGYPGWRWRVGYYDPWYWNSWAWGPSWSWGWGPSWSWGPSWGWDWGWGPSWHPGWHNPGVGGNTAWRPSPGASRPHASTGSWSGHRPSASGASSATGTASGFTRPGNMGRGRYTYTGTQSGNRPAQSTTSGNSSRPTQNYNSGNYGNRGRYNSGNNNATRTRDYNSTNSRSSSWSTGSSWGGNRGGGSSFGSGSGSHRSTGGGSFSGGSGGGGGRGRR